MGASPMPMPMPYALCPMPYARRVLHVTKKGYSIYFASTNSLIVSHPSNSPFTFPLNP